MKNDQFESMKKLTFIISVLLGIGFLLVGLAQVFLSIGNEASKLNLCLFALDALLGMSVIFFGFTINSFFKRFSEMEEKLCPEEEHHDEGF